MIVLVLHFEPFFNYTMMVTKQFKERGTVLLKRTHTMGFINERERERERERDCRDLKLLFNDLLAVHKKN